MDGALKNYGLAVNYTASAQRTLNGPLCARIGP
jgi:hypothetical protein